MLSKIFKKKPSPVEVVAPPVKQQESAEPWEARLNAAKGNDAELLQLAIEAPLIDTKLAAISSITSEEVMRAAEHEFRKHDRRVHSLAKQRHKQQVETRQARMQAAELIQTATALMDEPVIAANRLAELSAAWGQLPRELVEDQDHAMFAKLQNDLAVIMRERGEQKRAASRWSETATRALSELRLVCAEVTNDSAIAEDFVSRLASARERCNSALSGIPMLDIASKQDDEANTAKASEMRTVARDSEMIESRVALIAELQTTKSIPASSDEASEPVATNIASSAKQRWQDLPKLSDRGVGLALNAKFDELILGFEAERNQRHKVIADVARKQGKAEKQAQMQSLAAQTDALESELAAGHLAEAAKLLADLQKASEQGYTDATLHTRIGALQAEFLRLKGWQHWGGGRVREDLVQEAEALSASTAVAEGTAAVKLPIKQLEHDIAQLRDRWKELDRLGGATSKSLWERFDAALKSAYLPVAAHLAQLKAARQENLSARNKLLAELDALQISTNPDEPPDWKLIARALAHFQTEWRKLGPVEHTAPRKSQAALVARSNASVARLEVPLQEQQGDAQSQRERLIAKAKAMIEDAHGRNTMAALRDLQNQWQAQAKSLPLPRKVENRLWAEFRAAVDELMNQRAAEINARNEEFKASEEKRAVLITQLEKLHQDLPAADIKRAVAQVEKDWRGAGEASRKNASALEHRYRAAREQALANIEGAARRLWQRGCLSVLEKLVLCEAAESGTASSAVEDKWREVSVSPAAWEQPLRRRYEQAHTPKTDADRLRGGEELDQLLLQLESALDIPSPSELQSARHALKLQVMKLAMEGRTSSAPSWKGIETSVATALGLAPVNDHQRERLRSIVKALHDGNLRPH